MLNAVSLKPQILQFSTVCLQILPLLEFTEQVDNEFVKLCRLNIHIGLNVKFTFCGSKSPEPKFPTTIKALDFELLYPLKLIQLTGANHWSLCLEIESRIRHISLTLHHYSLISFTNCFLRGTF